MLLGFTGAIGCGKDTIAQEFITRENYVRHRFADPIKQMLQALGIPLELWEDRVRKEQALPWIGVCPRYLAQTLGTEWGRDKVDPEIWVKFAALKWSDLRMRNKPRMVVPDVRFENEARWILSEGGLVVRIIRSAVPETETASHVSESGLPSSLVSGVVFNNGTPEETYTRVDTLIRAAGAGGKVRFL